MVTTSQAGLMGAFGEKFRKARESKELSFDDVSNVIKITPRMLRAIEEENFDQLPGGVFNKGFIRSYAKHLGLDPEEAVTEYLEQIRQAQIQAQEAWQPPAVAEKRASTKKSTSVKKPASKDSRSIPNAHTAVEMQELPELQLPRAEHARTKKKEFFDRPSLDIPWKIVAVVIVIAILGSVLWFRHAHRRAAFNPTPAQVAVSTPATASPSPSNGSTPAPSSATPNVVAQNTSAPQAAASASPDSATDSDKNDVTVRNFGKPSPKSVE